MCVVWRVGACTLEGWGWEGPRGLHARAQSGKCRELEAAPGQGRTWLGEGWLGLARMCRAGHDAPASRSRQDRPGARRQVRAGPARRVPVPAPGAAGRPLAVRQTPLGQRCCCCPPSRPCVAAAVCVPAFMIASGHSNMPRCHPAQLGALFSHPNPPRPALIPAALRAPLSGPSSSATPPASSACRQGQGAPLLLHPGPCMHAGLSAPGVLPSSPPALLSPLAALGCTRRYASWKCGSLGPQCRSSWPPSRCAAPRITRRGGGRATGGSCPEAAAEQGRVLLP